MHVLGSSGETMILEPTCVPHALCVSQAPRSPLTRAYAPCRSRGSHERAVRALLFDRVRAQVYRASPSTRSGQRLLRCALLFSCLLTTACPSGPCPRTPVTAQTHCLRLTTSASHSATSDTFFSPCLRSFCVLAPRPRHCASVSRDHLHPRRHHRRGVHLVFLLPLFHCDRLFV